ncbi:MAG TPA: hypothetical protein VIH27_01530 [Nitrososphaerales archaeon]
MKKVITLAVIALILPLFSLASVSANPIWITYGLYPWVNYKVTGSGLHIASDPIFLSSDIPSPLLIPFDPVSGTSYMKGWVTFPCSTERLDQKNGPKGFEYSITVKDIASGTYTIKAYPTDESSDHSHGPYTLAIVNVGYSGEFEFNGFYDLAPAGYEWVITVESSGTRIFESHPADPSGFLVVA